MVAASGLFIISMAMRSSSWIIESSARNSLSGSRITVLTPGKLGKLGKLERPFWR